MTITEFLPIFRLFFPQENLNLLEFKQVNDITNPYFLIKVEDTDDGMIDIHTIESSPQGAAASPDEGNFEVFDMDDSEVEEDGEWITDIESAPFNQIVQLHIFNGESRFAMKFANGTWVDISANSIDISQVEAWMPFTEE